MEILLLLAAGFCVYLGAKVLLFFVKWIGAIFAVIVGIALIISMLLYVATPDGYRDIYHAGVSGVIEGFKEK